MNQEWNPPINMSQTVPKPCDSGDPALGLMGKERLTQPESQSDLLDRIKVLEGGPDAIELEWYKCQTQISHLTSLLRRIPLDLLRVEEHRQLYIDVCAALNIEPWVEKGG